MEEGYVYRPNPTTYKMEEDYSNIKEHFLFLWNFNSKTCYTSLVSFFRQCSNTKSLGPTYKTFNRFSNTHTLIPHLEETVPLLILGCTRLVSMIQHPSLANNSNAKGHPGFCTGLFWTTTSVTLAAIIQALGNYLYTIRYTFSTIKTVIFDVFLQCTFICRLLIQCKCIPGVSICEASIRVLTFSSRYF